MPWIRARALRWCVAATALVAIAAAPAPAQPERPQKTKTVIVGLAARRGVDQGLALAMSDIVQGAYSGDGGRIVLGREDLRRVLDFESERQALGCDTTACLSEIAQAMDVDRIVTGSMDKVGTSFLVVITEIDAKSVEPVARVQETLPAEEDKLIPAISALARKLVDKSRTARVSLQGPSAAPQRTVAFGGGTGALSFQMVPQGTEIKVAERLVGTAPARVDQLPPGEHKVELKAPGTQPVVVAVPVYDGASTDVALRPGQQAPLSGAQLQKYSDDRFMHTALLSGKIGVGSLCGLCGGCIAVPSTTSLFLSGDPSLFLPNLLWLGAGCGVLATGVGLAGWGIMDALNPPEPPTNPVVHSVTITPPAGRGEAKTVDIPAAQQMPH